MQLPLKIRFRYKFHPIQTYDDFAAFLLLIDFIADPKITWNLHLAITSAQHYIAVDSHISERSLNPVPVFLSLPPFLRGTLVAAAAATKASRSRAVFMVAAEGRVIRLGAPNCVQCSAPDQLKVIRVTRVTDSDRGG